MGFGNMDDIMNETTQKLEQMDDGATTSVSEDEVDNALAEIDVELSLDTGTALPSIPASVSEDQIDDWEKRAQDLKNQGGNP